jgi:hypothetical protein
MKDYSALSALIKDLDQPIQGKADWRKYRCFQILSNGITVCCVNDAAAKSTAVATTVNVGAAYDPRTISGLARTYFQCVAWRVDFFSCRIALLTTFCVYTPSNQTGRFLRTHVLFGKRQISRRE